MSYRKQRHASNWDTFIYCQTIGYSDGPFAEHHPSSEKSLTQRYITQIKKELSPNGRLFKIFCFLLSFKL